MAVTNGNPPPPLGETVTIPAKFVSPPALKDALDKAVEETNNGQLAKPDTDAKSVHHLGPVGEAAEIAADYIEKAADNVKAQMESYLEASRVCAEGIREIARAHWEAENTHTRRLKKAQTDIERIRDEFNRGILDAGKN